MKKISLRLRLTILNMCLLLICCLGLTLALNCAAINMADTIEAMPIGPAKSITNKNDAPAPETFSSSEPQSVPPASKGAPGTSDTALRQSSLPKKIGMTGSACTLSLSDTSREARTLFTRQSYLCMLLIAAAGGLFTWFITGRALRPLGRLSEEMQHRTVKNLSQALPVPQSHDEIASLTRSFNEMSAKLDESFSAQKRFAQSAAHELRTPLTVLKAKVDVFGKRAQHSPEEYEKLLQLIKKQTNRMADLVNDLLGLTNLDALTCSETVPLKQLLTEAVHELSPLAAEKDISLTLNVYDCQTVGNANLLYRTFSNLIENALKYNLPGGFVSVTAAKTDGKVLICVADNGPGIPDEQKALIFEPFYRVDKSRSRQMGGAGLGLATVKAILEKHKGEIRVADRPGGGTEFTVILP